jgi:hypothetical protein
MSTANEVAELDLNQLTGRSVEDATSIIKAAGGRVRVIAPGGVMTMEYIPTRVTLVAVDGQVERAMGPG